MQQALKTIEAIAELLYDEIKRVGDSEEVCDKAYDILREARVNAIELKRQIEAASDWIVVDELYRKGEQNGH